MRFLYRRAMKNIAAPYAAAAPTAPTATAAVVPLTDELVFWAFVLKTPLFPELELEGGPLLVPVPLASDPERVDPGVRGMAGLM